MPAHLHWQRFEEAIITGVEVIATIQRAIAKFLVAYPEVSLHKC
jgi:hypothetical protein